jgi:hypothetical protein
VAYRSGDQPGERDDRHPGGLGATPGSVVVGSTLVWVSDPAGATVYQIDPQRNLLLDERFEAAGALWYRPLTGTAWAAADGMRLIGIAGSASARTLFADEPDDAHVTALAAGPGGARIWAGTDTGTLLRFDSRTAS